MGHDPLGRKRSEADYCAEGDIWGARGHQMPLDRRNTVAMLSTRSAAALYVGAVLGPGVLLLPALAAQAAGPASLLAWVGLLIVSLALAATFAALGVRLPVGGGASAYVRAAYGPLPAAATGLCFLAGVVTGAPTVAL